MPKHRRRTMKGGFLDTLSSWGSSFTQSASSLWGKPKQTTTSSISNLYGSTAPTTSYTPTNSYTPTTTFATNSAQMRYGGKTRTRRIRGGYRDNISSTNLAADAAPFSGPTAQPHNWVGGKTRRKGSRRRGGRKSYKHRK
jgi:hypothetical protein